MPDANRLDTNFMLRLIDRLISMGAGAPADTDALPEGAVNQYFTEARVRATPLTGVDVVTPGVVTAADSVLTSIGKAIANLAFHNAAVDPHPQYALDTDLTAGLATKQDTLVSGTNLKTVNGNTLLGAGNLVIGGGTGDVVGPAVAVNNRVVFFDGITGKLIKDSGLTLSGSNTGDQTTIVGITGTKVQFDTACTDGNFLYVGDVTQYTDELAQDAVGAMVDASLVYVDATPLLQRAALTGDVTAAAGSNATTIANNAVTYAKMQDVTATARLLGRRTAGAGDPEECTISQALDFAGSTQGQILYRDAAGWVVLAPGTTGQALETRGAAANPVWTTHKRILANVTLGVAGTSLASGAFTACKFLEIHIFISGYAGSDTASLRFNADSGANYRYQWATMAAGATTFTAGLTAASAALIKVAAVNTTNSRRVVAFISNDSTVTEKLVYFDQKTGTGSAGTQATRDLGDGAWISGAATQITSVSLVSTSNMNAGTQVTIFGWN